MHHGERMIQLGHKIPMGAPSWRAKRRCGLLVGHMPSCGTAWVFSEHGNNFVKTMLRLGKTRESLNVVEDQIGGPTPAWDIATSLMVMARTRVDGQKGGTYHFAGVPHVSWAEFARKIMDEAGLTTQIHGITSAEYPTRASRPANSRLDCANLTADFGIAPSDWQAGLSRV